MDRKTFLCPRTVCAVMLAVFGAQVAGANSATVSYQGVLRDAALAPISDGTYQMRFSIFNVASGGAAVWGPETQPVTTRNGMFSVYLGSGVSLGTVFADNAALWLQIEADTGSGFEVYGPRVPLASVPYARQAVNADTVDGQHASAFAAASHNHNASAINAGTLSTDRFSAYDDLDAESKIGTGALQVAAGNHTHNTLSGPNGSPSNIVVVDSAGRVGVGTTTPTAGRRLDVNGALGFTGASAIGGQSTGQITRAPRVIRTGIAAGLSGCPVTLAAGGTLINQTFNLTSSAAVFVSGHAFRPQWEDNQYEVHLFVDGGQVMTYRVSRGDASAALSWGGILGAGDHSIQVRVGVANKWGCATDQRFDYLNTMIFE